MIGSAIMAAGEELLDITAEINRQLDHAKVLSELSDMLFEAMLRASNVEMGLMERFGDRWRAYLPWALRRVKYEILMMSEQPWVRASFLRHWRSFHDSNV